MSCFGFALYLHFTPSLDEAMSFNTNDQYGCTGEGMKQAGYPALLHQCTERGLKILTGKLF